MNKNKRRKSRTTTQKVSSKQLQFFILKLMSHHRQTTYSKKQILKKIKVKNSIDSVGSALDNLVLRGVILEEGTGEYRWNPNNKSSDIQDVLPSKFFTGRVDMTRTGAAYIVIDNAEEDVYVPAQYTLTAMDRDIVKVDISGNVKRRKPEGRIVEIIQRALTHVIGKLKIYKKYAVVYPILEGRFPETYVPLDHLNGAGDNQNVLVKITDWGQSQNKMIWGEVVKILKDMDRNDIAMESILLSNGFNLEFPERVIEEAETINGEITSQTIAQRRDMRDVLTITIDPATAKDFDDALSIKILENGYLQIGIHIADVTHYLKENSALDKEAFDRSTSVYLVDRVVPMLPERLSNDLCSLNPNEDKCTFSAIFTFDHKFKIQNEWFGRTIIHSDRRFTYEEAQERIESGHGDYAKELRNLNAVASKLRKNRYKNGSISFESEEVRFELDENNVPVGVYVKDRKEAHLLVEDFMLLANRSVAKFVHGRLNPEIPFIYRIHDLPDLDKLAEFSAFAKEMGYKINLDNPDKIAASLNTLTKDAQNDESLKMLLPLAIRTMSKAEYTTNNIGHYGLAFDYYTHFTSPIRRYSDVLVHRILAENLNKIKRRDKEILEAKCKHISAQERKAMNAERDSVKYKQVEFMLNKIGQTFDGVVSGMIDKGFFVEVNDSKAEGLIPFKNVDPSFQILGNRLKAVSKRTGDEIRMGSKVRIKLLEANLDKRLLEFSLTDVIH
jgi:ribonuclease R